MRWRRRMTISPTVNVEIGKALTELFTHSSEIEKQYRMAQLPKYEAWFFDFDFEPQPWYRIALDAFVDGWRGSTRRPYWCGVAWSWEDRVDHQTGWMWP